ncbi:MAG: aldo/keto reductase [Acidobacteria bacterium]|nr:aldo/keto reductase [Acidobacteriota bacterium]
MRLGLGCVTFGREIDEDASFRIMDYAVERDIRLFDTAEAYGGGASERIVGRWMESRGARRNVELVTKVLHDHTRAHVRQALEESLERLRTDLVDIYMFHKFDTGTPQEESTAAMVDALNSGRIRQAGCSNYTAAQLHPVFQVTECNYNLCVRDAEQELFPHCLSHGVRVLTYSPLGAGFLMGKYTPDRAAFPKGTRFDVIPGHADIYFSEQNFGIVRRLHALSARTGIQVPLLATAWVLHNRAVDTVLVGARSIEHLDNALAAARLDFDPAWAREILPHELLIDS